MAIVVQHLTMRPPVARYWVCLVLVVGLTSGCNALRDLDGIRVADDGSEVDGVDVPGDIVPDGEPDTTDVAPDMDVPIDAPFDGDTDADVPPDIRMDADVTMDMDVDMPPGCTGTGFVGSPADWVMTERDPTNRVYTLTADLGMDPTWVVTYGISTPSWIDGDTSPNAGGEIQLRAGSNQGPPVDAYPAATSFDVTIAHPDGSCSDTVTVPLSVENQLWNITPSLMGVAAVDAAAWSTSGSQSRFYMLDSGGNQAHVLTSTNDMAAIETSRALPGTGATVRAIAASPSAVYVVRGTTLHRLGTDLTAIDTVSLGFAPTGLAWAGGWLFASHTGGLSVVEDGTSTVLDVSAAGTLVVGLVGDGNAVSFHNNGSGLVRRVTPQGAVVGAWPVSECSVTVTFGFPKFGFAGSVAALSMIEAGVAVVHHVRINTNACGAISGQVPLPNPVEFGAGVFGNDLLTASSGDSISLALERVDISIPASPAAIGVGINVPHAAAGLVAIIGGNQHALVVFDGVPPALIHL